MLRILPDRAWPLYDAAATRRIEHAAAASLPSHALMQRAGLAVARLAFAVAPHARALWIACGPGNNGGDGLEAAMHLQQWGKACTVTWLGTPESAPEDALTSLARARSAGVVVADSAPAQWDLVIDGLLGIGSNRAPQGRMLEWMHAMNAGEAPVLSIDIPSGLSADSGTGMVVRATHTLSLLTLKPGLFTAQGRDAAGVVWLDDLAAFSEDATALLCGPPARSARPHASHKGSYGDVAIIGGAAGMTGAALLAASAALHAGSGRVFVGLLDPAVSIDTQLPELMFRAWESLDLRTMTIACGCGGGDAVRMALPAALSSAPRLVLDADALNAIAADSQLQAQLRARTAHRDWQTVITPHPLEAARLLESSTAQVQSDRLQAATQLARRLGCTAVLKGSGTVIAAPGERPRINPTGNARLATAGSGDVLAGWIAANLAAGQSATEAAASAVFLHGAVADAWPQDQPLTASRLAARCSQQQSA